MPEFKVKNVLSVTVDATSGETIVHLQPERGVLVRITFPKPQAEELCDGLYDGFCALHSRDDACHEALADYFTSLRFDIT